MSIITEDWRFRMVTPPKGDYASVPLNAEGRRVADAWDLNKDEAAGNQCKAYGAAAIMRVPGRFHITWDNPTTLKIEADLLREARVLAAEEGTSISALLATRLEQIVTNLLHNACKYTDPGGHIRLTVER